KDAKDGKQALARRGGAALDLGLEPFVSPQLLPLLEESQYQVVLGAKMPVETHLGYAGSGDDGVHSDGADSLPAEQVVGGRQDLLAGAGCFGAHPRLRPSCPIDTHLIPSTIIGD